MPEDFKTTKDIKVNQGIIDQVIGQDDAVRIMKKAALQQRHVLLIGEPGTGKCVGQNTSIITEVGPIKSKDLFDQLRGGLEVIKENEIYVIPDKNISVFSVDTKGKVVKNKILRAYKGKRKKGIKISTKSGAEFVVSGEHPLLTIKNGQMLFLASDEINESSYIALARKIPNQNSNNLININNLYSPNLIVKDRDIQFVGLNGVKSLKLSLPKQIDKDLAYFIGMCVGEARWQGNFIIYNKSKVIQEHIINILKEKFNYPAEYIVQSNESVFLKKSRTFAHIMEKCFDFPLNPAKQSYHKTIPKQIFNADPEIAAEFIAGLVDADGHIGARGFEITSSSKDLIAGLRILLLKFEITCRESSSLKYATNTKLRKKNIYHRLSIFDSENLKKLNNCLNLKLSYKKRSFSVFTNKKSNTNIDIIPSIGQKIYELKNKSELSYKQLEQHPATFHKFRHGKRNISRTLASTVVDSIKDHTIQSNQLILLNKENINELDLIIKSDIFWDKIKSMSLVEDDMYDFEIENTHNMLISSGVIAHNSMLGMGLAELLPAKGQLEDSLCYPNEKDPNNPLIKTFTAGQGEQTVINLRHTFEASISARRILFFVGGGLFLLIMGTLLWNVLKNVEFGVLAAVNGITSMLWLFIILGFLMSRAPGLMRGLTGLAMMPKPLITHKKNGKAPFIDATGAQAGALLGDVLHDPLQSGGLGTPAHERVMPGMIHKAHKGVLFIDEIATLSPRSQQELLTALQEGKYQITGQSERSSGSMVRTDPVPCRFVMVAAGNMDTVQQMHPALRSRIRGYGYEVSMKETMPDTPENRYKIAVFVAQEVKKDEKIPQFSKDAVEQIIREARKMANRKEHLTLRLRELGGLVRAAGDVAFEEKAKLVERKHVIKAKIFSRTLEQQIADKYIEHKREYEIIKIKGKEIGRVNGLAVITAGTHAMSGIVLPIESEVTPGGKESEIIATGKLGEIAKEAIKNVSAVIKNYFGEDIKETKDIFVQFVQTHSGVEGDSASIAVAVSIMSALKKLPVRQDFAMTGSLSVRGDVLPVGGVSSKIEAAIEAGITHVIVPKSNMQDIVLDPDQEKKIKIYPVERIEEVFERVFDWTGKEKIKKILMRK